MKFLRGLYIVIATMALLPLILLFKAIYLIYVVYKCIQINESQRALKIWYKCLFTGISMNLDFIKKNGLDLPKD